MSRCRCRCLKACAVPAGCGFGSTQPIGQGSLSGLWHQLTLLFVLGGGVALVAAFLTTTLYTRKFPPDRRYAAPGRSRHLRGPSRVRQPGRSRCQLGLDRSLGDEQRRARRCAGAGERLAIAARTLAHEVEDAPQCVGQFILKCCAIKVNGDGDDDARSQRSSTALDSSIRQVDRLVRRLTDYLHR